MDVAVLNSTQSLFTLVRFCGCHTSRGTRCFNLFTFRNFLNVKRLEALVPLGVGRVLLTTDSDTGLGAVDVAVLELSHFSHCSALYVHSSGSDPVVS